MTEEKLTSPPPHTAPVPRSGRAGYGQFFGELLTPDRASTGSPQVSRSLGRSETIINVCFLGRDAIDSSMISPLTHTEGAAEHLSASVRDQDVHDENGNELARTRRRHSLGTSYDHPGLAGRICEAVRRCRGRAYVAPRPWCL